MNNHKRSELLDISLDFIAGHDQEALNSAQALGICNTDLLRTKAYADASDGDAHALGVLVRPAVKAATNSASEEQEEVLYGWA